MLSLCKCTSICNSSSIKTSAISVFGPLSVCDPLNLSWWNTQFSLYGKVISTGDGSVYIIIRAEWIGWTRERRKQVDFIFQFGVHQHFQLNLHFITTFVGWGSLYACTSCDVHVYSLAIWIMGSLLLVEATRLFVLKCSLWSGLQIGTQ